MKTLKINCTLILSLFFLNISFAQTRKALLENGTAAGKFDIVFMGDGFTAAQQGEFNTLVDNYFKNMFTYQNGDLDNVLAELKPAFNVYRVNMNSDNAGVTQYTCTADGDGGCRQSSVSRSTAFNFQYSGCWKCCWMQKSSDTDTRINNALAAAGLAGADYVVMILNETGFGGCSYGRVLSITKTTTNQVLFHELGHSVGGLADEYDQPGCFGGSEPATRNVSVNQKPSKWDVFARGNTTTGNPQEYNVSEKGEFQGAQYSQTCIFRPSINSTMRGNTNLVNPPSYDEFWARNRARSSYDFDTVYVGDFGGDGHSDVVVHFGDYLAGYLVGTPDGFTGSGTETRVTDSYFTSKQVNGPGGSWNVNALDRFVVGDFSGDGKDDLIAFFPNGANSRFGMLEAVQDSFRCVRIYNDNLPYWQMRDQDQYFLADFNGDGKKDVIVFNTVSWMFGYLGMLESNGNSLTARNRYDRDLPGHQMGRQDKIFVADIDGDRKEEIVLFQADSRTTRLFKSNGTSLTLSGQYIGNLPGYESKAGDQYFIADFTGDGKDDLYVFNGSDWESPYLAMLKSNGSGYDFVQRYEKTLPSMRLGEYREVNRDDWSVYLQDPERKIDLALDLFRREVKYRATGQAIREALFTITEAFPSSPSGPIPAEGAFAGLTEIPANGRNANIVQFGRDGNAIGHFRQMSANTWREEKAGAPHIQYREWNRDDWTIYLFDDATRTNVWIDLHTKKITHKGPNDPEEALRYTVLNASARMNGRVTNAVTYADASGRNLGRFIKLSSGSWAEELTPAWNMNSNDQYYVADINGDGREDLYVYNPTDWATEWLGSVISSGPGLNFTSPERDKIGVWDFQESDKLIVDNRKTGRDNLFIHRSDWFGYIWSVNSGLKLNSVYKDYIHNFKHHDKGWY